MNKKTNKLLILSLLAFITINFSHSGIFKKIKNKITGQKEHQFSSILEKTQSIGELQELIGQAIKSEQNINLFTNKIEEFVNEREDNELDIIKSVINYTLYNPEMYKYPETKKRLTELRTRSSKPMTTMEMLTVTQKAISNPEKIAQFRDDPEKLLDKLVVFVSERTDKTKEAISNLLNIIRTRRIFTNKEDINKLDELITIVPKAISLYEKIYTLYLQLKKLDPIEAELKLSKLMKEYKKQTSEAKKEVKDKLELLLNTIIYNSIFSVQQQQKALKWLSDVMKKENVKAEKKPKKYSDRIEFYYEKALDNLAIPENRAELLSGLAKLSKEKMKAIGSDLQILIATLKFLQLSPYFTDIEKIQLTQFISDIEAEVSVSNIISKIYSLLATAQTDESTRNYIVKLIEKAAKSLEEQIKKDKKIPDEYEMFENLLSLYILDSEIYANKKSEIQRIQEVIKKTIETIKKPETKKITTSTKPTDIRRSRRIIRK